MPNNKQFTWWLKGGIAMTLSMYKNCILIWLFTFCPLYHKLCYCIYQHLAVDSLLFDSGIKMGVDFVIDFVLHAQR